MKRRSSKITILELCTLFIVLISGCAQRTPAQVSHTAVGQTTSSYPSNLPEITNAPGSQITKLPPIVISPSSASTSEPDVSLNLNHKCLRVALDQDHTLNGSIIYQNGYDDEFVLLQLENGAEMSLGKAFPLAAISPDFKYLAFTSEDPAQLQIVDANGKRDQAIEIPDNWQGVIQWLDDDTLLVQNFLHTPYNEASAIIFNLETGFQKEFLPNFPYFETFVVSPLWGNFSYSRMIFDRYLSRVIYPQVDDKGNRYFALMDLTNQRSILRLHQFPDSGAPQWLHDGSQVIVGLYPKTAQQNGQIEFDNSLDDLPYKDGYDLFSISRDGSVRRLTYFTTQFSAAEESFALSPDQKHVAFWLNLDYKLRDSSSERELTILDINTREVTSLCLSTKGTLYEPIIWSPDGKYLIVTLEGSQSNSIVLIDLEKGFASRLFRGNRVAIAWLSKN